MLETTLDVYAGAVVSEFIESDRESRRVATAFRLRVSWRLYALAVVIADLGLSGFAGIASHRPSQVPTQRRRLITHCCTRRR